MNKRQIPVILLKMPMQWRSAYVVILVLSFLPLYLPRSAIDPGVQLGLTPAVIQLASGETAEALVIVQNATSSWVRNLQLDWFTEVGVVVQGDLPERSEIQPGGTLAWRIRITSTGTGRASGNIYFQLNYVLDKADGSQPLHGVAVNTLEIQERAPEPVNQMAEVRIETTVDQIQEQRPGLIFLLVRNLANVPITLTTVTAYEPSFIDLQVPDLGHGMVLVPQSSRTLTVPVSVSDRAQTGPQRLVFEVGVAWNKGNQVGSGNLVVAHTVTVDILGESDLLKLVGVPSFLFLPGFLMLTTFITLWTRVSPKPKTKIEFGVPEYALLSITLSLLAAAVYPWITTIAGEPRNYLQAYGLRDVFQVWFGSVAIGIISWIAIAGGWALRGRYQQYRQQVALTRRTLTKDDTPLRLLEKMTLNGIPLPSEVANIGSTTGPQCFIIMNKDQPSIWVTPSIILRHKQEALHQSADQIEDQETLLDQIQSAKSPQKMAEVLRQSITFRDIAWNGEGSIVGPTLIDSKAIFNRRMAQRYFVDVEP